MDSVGVVNLQNSTTLSNLGSPGSGPELGKTEFLKLLMAQLSHQDPTNPMDNQAFIAQLAQFANVEQLGNLGSKLDDLVRVSAASNSANAVSLLGKAVRISGNEFRGSGASLYYELESPAHSVQIEIRKPDGSVVNVIDQNLETTEGLHEVKVDGLPEGDYKFYVVAKDSQQGEIGSATSVSEFVEGVNFSEAVPLLLMKSGKQISAAEIVEIREPVHQGG